MFFSVSNHELLYLHGSPTNIIVEPVDHRDYVSSFSGREFDAKIEGIL